MFLYHILYFTNFKQVFYWNYSHSLTLNNCWNSTTTLNNIKDYANKNVTVFYKQVCLVNFEWSMWKRADRIQNLVHNSPQWWDYKGDNGPPPPTRRIHTHIHALTHKSMGPKCNFHANLEHTYKKISIFSVMVTQTLCFLCLTFWFIYTFILILFPPSPHSVSLSLPHVLA